MDVTSQKQGRAAIYIRRSTDEQSEYSIEAQERQCRMYCALQQWDVVQVYTDDDLSGRKHTRPAFQRLLSDAQRQQFRAIVVHKLDRWSRDAATTLRTIDELDKLGIQLISVSEQIDFVTPQGRMVLTVMAGSAEYYSRNLGTETRKGLQEKAQQGNWVGPAPLGYEKDGPTLKPNAQADVVRFIFSRYASGVESYMSLADTLNARGYRTSKGTLFGRESIRTILKNRAYLGCVSCGGQEYTGRHEALIDVAIFDAAQRIMDERDAKGHKYSAALPKTGGLLTERINCAVCGAKMWYRHQQRTKTHSRYYYRCSGVSRRTCNTKMQRADIVEAEVLGILRGLVLPAEWQEQVLEKALEQARTTPQPVVDQRFIQREMRRLRADYIEGKMDDAAYQDAYQKLEALREHPPEPIPVMDMKRAAELVAQFGRTIDEATPDEKRSIIRQMFSRVWVADKHIEAITPTALFHSMLEATRELQQEEGVHPRGTNFRTTTVLNYQTTLEPFQTRQNTTIIKV
jgi:site-specific DNA recombinase